VDLQVGFQVQTGGEVRHEEEAVFRVVGLILNKGVNNTRAISNNNTRAINNNTKELINNNL